MTPFLALVIAGYALFIGALAFAQFRTTTDPAKSEPRD